MASRSRNNDWSLPKAKPYIQPAPNDANTNGTVMVAFNGSGSNAFISCYAVWARRPTA
jgi:hypothetical protein